MNTVFGRVTLVLFLVSMCLGVVQAREKYAYKVAVAAIFKNEASILKEWIEFHKLVGVKHFYLYNNQSSDNYREVLEPYIQNGLVELIDWDYSSEQGSHRDWMRVQSGAYRDAITHAIGVAKWVAFIDTDEFLFPTKKRKLKQVLKEFDDYGGLVVNWQLYGTSNVQKIPQNALMTERLIYKAKTDYTNNKRIKSIVRPERVSGCKNPHFMFYKDDYYAVNEEHQRVGGRNAGYVSVEKIRINHYWTRAENWFRKHKINRRLEHGWGINGVMQRYRSLNHTKDRVISRYLAALKRAMGMKH